MKFFFSSPSPQARTTQQWTSLLNFDQHHNPQQSKLTRAYSVEDSDQGEVQIWVARTSPGQIF